MLDIDQSGIAIDDVLRRHPLSIVSRHEEADIDVPPSTTHLQNGVIALAPLPHLSRFLRRDRAEQERILDLYAQMVWVRYRTWATLKRMNPRGSYRRMRENAVRRWKRIRRLCVAIDYKPRIRVEGTPLTRPARPAVRH